MTTQIHNFQDALETLWAGVTPPSDGWSTKVYRWIDTLDEERRNGGHRELIWRLETDSNLTEGSKFQEEHNFTLELFFHRGPDVTYKVFRRSVEAETQLLKNAFYNLTAFGAGVLEAHLDGSSTDEPEPDRPPGAAGVPRTQVARVTFQWRVLAQEA